ncbi:hypothetical protein ACPCI0_31885 [Streptomyces griseoincarnatus]
MWELVGGRCGSFALDSGFDSQFRLAAGWKLATLGDARTADLCQWPRLRHHPRWLPSAGGSLETVELGDTRARDIAPDGDLWLATSWKLTELSDTPAAPPSTATPSWQTSGDCCGLPFFPVSVQLADHMPTPSAPNDWDQVRQSFETISRPQKPSWLRDMLVVGVRMTWSFVSKASNE